MEKLAVELHQAIELGRGEGEEGGAGLKWHGSMIVWA
jgi:hypothetical protein